MAEAVQPQAIRFGHVDTSQSELLAQHRGIANEAWRIELVTPRTILESFKVLRWALPRSPSIATDFR
jgi:hypothetical protein